MKPEKPPVSKRFFRFLLRLFPFDFRSDYGPEMEEVFHEQQKDAVRRRGTVGLLQLWRETLVGILRTAPREHWEMFRQDVGYALRMMRKNLGFTAVAILTLALGIGANTAIFSMVNGVLLRSLPYQEGKRVIVLRQAEPGTKIEQLPFSVKEILDFRQQTQTLDEVVEFHDMEFTLLGRGEPQRVYTGVVSANFFTVLGVKPLLGRTFLPGEDEPGTPPIMVLSHRYWQNRLGGDPDVIGETFELNGNLHTVVGVLPPVPQYPEEVDVYMPISHCPTRSSQQFIDNRNARMMEVFGRLKPGVTPEQARSDVARIAAGFPQDHPEVYSAGSGYFATSAPLKVALTKRARPTLLVLLFAAGFVLLIACANVANLMLSRLLRRERELAIRSALGAGRSRLLRQLLTESTLLSLAGGALGLLLAAWGLDLLVAFAARFTTRAYEISIDSTVLLYTLTVALATGVLFGAIPALKARANLTQALNESGGRTSAGGGTHRLRSLLVVSQVTVSLVLLVGAGLMLRSFIKLQQVDAGFNPENVLSMRVGLNWQGFDQNLENRMEFFRVLFNRLEGLPNVVSAGITGIFPLGRQQGFPNDFEIEGRPLPDGRARPVTEINVASPDYFRTLGIPLLRGRFFDDSDDGEAPKVVIVNEAMARHNWPDEYPIGKRISLNRGEDWWTIVGVVGDTRQFGLDQKPVDEIYIPFWQGNFAARLMIRTTSDPARFASTVTQIIREIAPDQTVDNVQTLEQVRSESVAPTRLTTILIALFAALALTIAAAGIGGVMALSVSQRTHEIGIRMALGATPGNVLATVMRQGMTLVVAGLAFGVVVSLALTRFMSDLLFEVQPTDPTTLIAVALVLTGTAAAACLLPARRAVNIDPIVALRTE